MRLSRSRSSEPSARRPRGRVPAMGEHLQQHFADAAFHVRLREQKLPAPQAL